MNKKNVVLVMSILSLFAVSSCKKTSTVDDAVNWAVKEYKALNSNNAYKYSKYKHNYETAKEYINTYNSTEMCGQCNGYGVLYLVNSDGSPILDVYGDYQFTSCDQCGGYGYVSVN